MRITTIFIILTALIFSFDLPKINIPDSIKNIGKKTPIDIEIYIKNPSTKCSLRVRNISNPYNTDIRDKFPIILLKPGSYYYKSIKSVLKGKYEFEYKWYNDSKFIDSGVETIHIFAYHDKALTVYKTVKIDFRDVIPKECR